MIKRLLKALLCASLLVTGFMMNPIKIEANGENIEIVNIYYPEGQQNVLIKFVDEQLNSNYNEEIQNRGSVVETIEYDYSYYEYKNYAITTYDYGSVFNQKTLITVSKGSKKKLDKSVTTSTTVGFNGSVDGKIKELINLKVTANAQGTYSHTWSSGAEYDGPSESSSYDYFTYYGGLRYDLATFYIYRYDVNKVYYNGVYSHSTTSKSQISVTGVKIPKVVEYRKGGNV